MINDLSTSTTDELLDELMSRQESAVYVGRPLVDKDFNWQVRTTGPIHLSLGLIALAQFELAKKAVEPLENQG